MRPTGCLCSGSHSSGQETATDKENTTIAGPGWYHKRNLGLELQVAKSFKKGLSKERNMKDEVKSAMERPGGRALNRRNDSAKVLRL